VSHQYRGHEAEFDEEFEDEAFEEEERKPRFWVRALVCVALAATGSGAAFAWHGYGDRELITAALSSTPKAAAPQAAAAQDALLKNLVDAQQRAAATAQRNQELLQAQAADIKRLSDTVAQLATRVESLSVRNAQAAVVAPSAPKKPAAPKAVAPKPAAPAPLSLAPENKQ
jgi:hypothetical protein